MNLRRSVGSLFAAALWLTAAGRGAGQSSDEGSHRPRSDDVRPPISSPEKALADRLGSLKSSETDQLLQSLLKLSARDKDSLARSLENNPKLRESLKEELLKDRNLRETLSRSIDQNRLTAEDKKSLGKLAAKFKDEKPDHGRPDPVPPTDVKPDSTKPVPMPAPPTTTPGPSPSERPSPAAEAKAKEAGGANKFLTKALPKAADLLAEIGLKDDAEFLRQLLRGKVSGDNNGYLAQSIRRATKVAKELPLDKVLSGDLSGAFNNLHIPSLPKFNFSFGGDSSAGGPSGASGGLSGEGAGGALVWVLVLIVLVALLWKGKTLLPSARKALDAWKLGPWPVRPDRVRTRAELIQAFEYLAYLVLGLAARPRNHLDLASDLAATDGEEGGRRTAAERLSRLYERARYAPEEEALPDDELRAARHDLTYLAGVGRA